MSGRIIWIILIGVLFSFTFPSDDIYDQKGYFMFPIRPGEINYLSGSMGELRSTHFHSGIDIKTGGVQGYNVYAAADGFLNRVNVNIGGYGKAMYIQHPNNTFTVYAHLRDFSSEVADYVREQQYKKKSYVVDLFPPKGALSFFKGDIIAASGNTGSSSAPHLHFEIRDQDHRILDPLRFGFPEIRDSRVPEVRAVAFKTMDIDARVNGRFGRYDFNTARIENKFSLEESVDLRGKIGVEIYAFDRQNDTRNRYGLPCVEFYLDDSLVYSHHIRTFSFRNTRDLLVHTNYPHMLLTRRRFHKLYVDDGNQGNFYGTAHSGIIDIDDSMQHDLTVKIWDVEGNFSETNFQVNEKKGVEKKPYWFSKKPYQVVDNTLQLAMDLVSDKQNHITIYANRFMYELEPAFRSSKKLYYLWDLREGLPDSIDFCGKVIQPNFKELIPPGAEFKYFSERFDLKFGWRTLFDTLYLQASTKYDSTHQREEYRFEHPTVPIRTNARVTLKPGTIHEDKERTAVYAISPKGDLSYFGGDWKGNQISFNTRELVNFTLATDSVPPTIKPVRINKDQLRFIIEDKMSGIASFNAYVDGEWVLMNYESKKNLIWSEKLYEDVPFEGELVLEIKDNAGNLSVFNKKI